MYTVKRRSTRPHLHTTFAGIEAADETYRPTLKRAAHNHSKRLAPESKARSVDKYMDRYTNKSTTLPKWTRFQTSSYMDLGRQHRYGAPLQNFPSLKYHHRHVRSGQTVPGRLIHGSKYLEREENFHQFSQVIPQNSSRIGMPHTPNRDVGAGSSIKQA